MLKNSYTKMNNYKKAIIFGLEQDFLLGKNEYFVLNRDFGNHDITATYMDILNYSYEIGENKLFIQLEKDIIDVINNGDVFVLDLTNLIGIFFFYFTYKFEYNKFSCKWNFSNALQKILIDKIRYMENENLDISKIIRITELIKERYNFNLLGI